MASLLFFVLGSIFAFYTADLSQLAISLVIFTRRSRIRYKGVFNFVPFQAICVKRSQNKGFLPLK